MPEDTPFLDPQKLSHFLDHFDLVLHAVALVLGNGVGAHHAQLIKQDDPPLLTQGSCLIHEIQTACARASVEIEQGTAMFRAVHFIPNFFAPNIHKHTWVLLVC